MCIAAGLYPRATTGTAGIILTSGDAGTTWHVAKIPVWVSGITSLGCSSTSFCVAAGDVVLVSYDAGGTWQARSVKDGIVGSVSSLSCASSVACFGVGANPIGTQNPSAAGLLISTTDQGASFQNLSLPAGTSRVSAISCVPGVCYAAGLGARGAPGVFLETSNDGASWSLKPLPSALSAVTALSCKTSTACVLVGDDASGPATASTSDSGATWTITSIA